MPQPIHINTPQQKPPHHSPQPNIIADEFWTAKQRQANKLHEISYRACFKPALAEYFIERYSKTGDVVYDPFGGRGTTAVQASLMGRIPLSNDINPLSKILTEPRLNPPCLPDIERRLNSIFTDKQADNVHNELSMFYHDDTYRELLMLKDYLNTRKKSPKKSPKKSATEDSIDKWIRMVATNRLTGHSSGFFSVYTLPPNQATSKARQIKINQARNQTPDYRNVSALIMRKSKSLLSEITDDKRAILQKASKQALILNEPAHQTTAIKQQSVALVVTSPPFLDIVNYAQDNWLRCWFNDIDIAMVKHQLTMCKTLIAWEENMLQILHELKRILKPNGIIAFEVGEVRKGKVKLDESIVRLSAQLGLTHDATLINQQKFTKTANIWGVKNNDAGTNSNRIVLLRK
ncbi:MAG: site-specific DNA-methyltransferase [Alphaproteobacteria bacterium]|nr:site-specific DNA-methyltransferase [Alphaproteobacteria bacterium]